MMKRSMIPLLVGQIGWILASLIGPAQAALNPDWVAHLPAGSSLTAGIQGFAVSPSGVSYVTGITGSSSNTDVVTAAFRADGTLLWSHVYNGPGDWHDQARGLALGPSGELYVTGNTPGPGSYSNLLLLKYDAATGALLNTVQYSSGFFTSEFGGSVATDAQGGVYVAGGTVGDGADAMILKFDANGALLWRRVWDGPAGGPFSQDSARQIQIDPDGFPVVLIHGVMGSQHPDYVVVKYAPADGSTVWEANWGSSGEDAGRDMVIDLNGDVYVTGTAINLTDQYSTIKLDGDNGQLIWQAFDTFGFRDNGRALALDDHGGVYITGSVDPEGDLSNFNDQIYTVKRDAFSGAQLWTHLYGDTCVGCFDVPADIIVDPDGHVFVAGSTSSAPYTGDMITLVLDATSGVETDRGILPGTTGEEAGPGFQRFDAAYNLFDGGQASNATTGETQISVVKYPSQVTSPYALEVTNLIGGGTASFVVGNGTPSTMQYVLLSLQGLGSVPIPSFGITLNLESPILILFGSSDGAGTYSVPVQVPAGAVGRTLWFQAAELNRTTPVVRRVVG